ncbi:MAG: type II toxin-antitoxin system HicB family antitoxin [Planctomycetaceae bacterium]
MNALRVPLRVVFYEEEGEWVAHCLEFDLVGCAATREAALLLLSEAIVTQLEATRQNQNLANLLTPASGEVRGRSRRCGMQVEHPVALTRRGDRTRGRPRVPRELGLAAIGAR